MINKNFYRKTNDKKILHKVGKQWKVISVALLMAIGGGAAVAATNNASANADANDNINNNTAAEVSSLEAKPQVQSAQSVAPSSKASSASAKPAKPASSVSYMQTYGGSAASYRAKAINDNFNYKTNNSIVQKYVNSLNAEYPTQTNSLQASYNSASDKTSADQSSANYFSGIAAQPNYASTVNSLAARANMTSSAYIESVGASASNYNDQLSYGASAVSEMNIVNSYAQEISAINGNKVLSTEYHDNYLEAKDEVSIAQAYNNNAKAYYSNVASNSAANDASLGTAQAKLASDSTEEQIALINSGLDNSFVQSVANSAAGSNFANSQSVSNIVSTVASMVNAKQQYALKSADNASVPVKDVDNYFVNASSANADNNTVSLNYEYLGGTDGNEFTFAASNGTKGTSVTVAASSADLVRDVSDTAAQFKYSAESQSLTNEINSAKAAKASYSDAVVSASVAAQSAANNLSSAQSNYSAASVLGNNPTLAKLFAINEGNNYTANDANKYVASIETSLNHKTNTDPNKGTTEGVMQDAVNDMINSLASTVTNHDVSTIQTKLKSLDWSGIANDVLNAAKATDATNTFFTNTFTGKNDAKDDKSLVGFIRKDSGNGAGHSENFYITMLKAFNNNNSDVKGALTVTAVKNAINVASLPSATGAAKTVDGILNASSYSAAYNDILKGATVKSGSAADAPTEAILNNASGSDAFVSLGASAIASLANSTGTSYKNASSASASYSAATDENVALASSYANSYSNLLSSDSANQSAAKNSLDTFYTNHADASFASALTTAESAAAAEPNDHALAMANGNHVFNYAPKYLNVLKNGLLHKAIDYGTKGDAKLAKVPAGTKLAVKGIGIAANGVVRYEVNYGGKTGYFTDNEGYVKPAYLFSADNASVTTLKPVRVYNSTDFNKKNYVETLPANQTLTVDVISMDNTYGGYTRVETPSGEFFTANTNYVGFANVSDNGNVHANGNGVHFWA